MKIIQEVLDAVSRETEKVISEIGVPVACSAGCSACCKQPIPISFAEARHAMESYRERYGAKALKRLVKKARKDLRDVSMVTTVEEYVKNHSSCPFLEHGLCSVWSARPKVCRSHVHHDRAICEADLRDGRKGLPMINDPIWEEYHNASMDALNALRPEYPPEMRNSLVLIQQAIDTVAAGNVKVAPGTVAIDKYCEASVEAELANMGRAT